MYAIANYVIYENDKIAKLVLDMFPNLKLITSIEEDKYEVKWLCSSDKRRDF